ncbi:MULTISPECIES: SDR family NAD(P)-dependent oxidoreductase [Thalassospira]|jgi:NAD(P)-dependent dehydrogenase (short-subunit alcohol dehydrogenase family)|uniref:Oxidoreductase n=1 Tax=Thalassospira povalilytica TaxID=732237 RepID=A0A8I1MAY5_9PROT|nr:MULTISPECIES: SDR family NAD(P)-dependent oxidoreductase [Thalassospira]MEE3044085.1 SDR family NAD(P)-dependent oxidoreductase [Pseudomonadota bacterium]MAL39342.1 oxidoreductase [Thalassospira sp.]MBN8198695.1 SDR family NAD(P)-dependent oxidoreductase [Thalassospira povalilytica]PKR48277.1 oxidoreductase [Thalassospira povalilytica]URK19204.1 SDR family NAD(P)-dependent oxidoreductase [Thalassospira sp. GO-4]|tara:strand:- start:781 stop:1494 length:714 start_codon:yes stop_codon:yes gene_type:complete|eukprot:TRINITY_DN1183_c0_g3_i3.p2 TRINITY_DN1183_c0_g3~~TRINITY_DN1183_c0_g3_i3.p2  ORF type:complete len:238 (+),score=61.47 TRINITY_DN1183_c0_g3_i3:307-1020(+)
MTDTKRLEGRVALITGASHGIGYAVAKRFAAEGAQVIAIGRNVGALEELSDEITDAGGKISLLPLDLTMFEKVDAIGPTIYERFGKLDIVVGNAGLLGEIAPVGHIDTQVFDNTVATNVTSNFRLIRTVDKLLQLSDAGRAIFVTSNASAKGRAFWGLYAATKAALEALVLSYAQELEESKVRVNLINPGRIRTKMRAEAYPGEDPETLPTPDSITDVFVDLAEASCTKHGEVVNAY